MLPVKQGYQNINLKRDLFNSIDNFYDWFKK